MTPNRLLTPAGLLRPDPALETFVVRPRGVTAIEVHPGDVVELHSPFGGQVAELTLLAGGRSDDAAGVPADAPATVLRALGDAPGVAGTALLTTLRDRGLDPHAARCARLLDGAGPAGERVAFGIDRAALAVVAAPAGRAVDGDDPGAELHLAVRRATPRERPAEGADLPPPLAEPRVDLRIDAATAQAYEVRAGEYVQVIDVAGRQCSDLLAFSARRLQDGVERGLDSTVTRTLTGTAYPRPGLHRTFFDADFEPLLDVVQDTVGRHDAFALACTAKYYEDLGYPGHANCSDNYNEQLASYGIAPRRGWPAINLFYNTFFDEDLALHMDEPWSRPGDHVLFRARTDLVCASSACPDDIDASNGWAITDIHVRVYPPENRFSMAISRRVTPDAPPEPTRPTAFHPRTSALTRDFVEYAGSWLADGYTGHGPVAEYWACRERVAVMDLSALRKWEVLGPDAETLLQHVVTRDVRRLAVGQVSYTALCHETGGMVDDATLFRLGENAFRFVGGDPYDGPWLQEHAKRLALDVHVKPSSDELHNLAVQGPCSRDVLRDLVWTPPVRPSIAELRWFRFTVGRLHGPGGVPVVVSRTGYTGELGYEVWCHPDDGPAVWDAVWAAGEPHGIAPLGLAALEVLRVEAGLVAAGREFDDDVDPYEAGVGFTVALDGEDFVGRAALVERHAHPQRRLVGLDLDGPEVAHHGDPVYAGRHRIGVVTSGVRSPVLRRSVALCRLATTHAAPGTRVEVGKLDGHRKRLDATVTSVPAYDPEKRRPRA